MPQQIASQAISIQTNLTGKQRYTLNLESMRQLFSLKGLQQFKKNAHYKSVDEVDNGEVVHTHSSDWIFQGIQELIFA